MASLGSESPAPEQQLTLEDILQQLRNVSELDQFTQGFNAQPNLMFEVFKTLTARNDALALKEAELAQAEKSNTGPDSMSGSSSKAKRRSSSGSDDLLARLVDLLDNRNRAPTPRSAEHRETELFSGQKKDFATWKESVMLKLNVNADHYPTEQSKMALVYSLLNSESKTHLRAWLKDGVLTFPSLQHMWDLMTTLFDDPNAARDAAARVHSNYQKNRPFSTWIAEIRRDAMIAGYDTESLQLRNLVFLNMSVELKRALIHERDIDSLKFDEAVSRLQDIDNRQRALNDLLSRGGRRNFAGGSDRRINQSHQDQSASLVGDPMDLSAVRFQSRGPLSQEERERRRREGLCYYCGEPGHKSGGCPRKHRPQVVGRAADIIDTESTESGNAATL